MIGIEFYQRMKEIDKKGSIPGPLPYQGNATI
jgi:hypothetical protein